MPVITTRALILLLAFRVILAPYSYRATMKDHSVRYALVMRVCKWPHQRLERFSSTSKVMKLFEGKNRAVPEQTNHSAQILASWSSQPGALLLLIDTDASPPLPSLLASHLRC